MVERHQLKIIFSSLLNRRMALDLFTDFWKLYRTFGEDEFLGCASIRSICLEHIDLQVLAQQNALGPGNAGRNP